MSMNNADLNFGPLSEDFFKLLKSKGRSFNTIKNYKTDLECFRQYIEQNYSSESLSHFDNKKIKLYGHYLEERYQSDNSRRRRVQTLRIFFDFLVEKSFFDSNPVRQIPTSPKFVDCPRPAKLVHIQTAWEYLLKIANNSKETKVNRLIAERNQLLILFIYGAGLKVSNLSNLKVEHLYLKSDPPRVLISPPKREPYTIPLPIVFKELFEKYSQNLSAQKKVSDLNFSDVLFNANPHRVLSGGLSPRGIELVFEDIRKQIVSNDLTAKSLRQACVFKWLKQKCDHSLIKEWLGVAPSYSLKPYVDLATEHIYDDHFLLELYKDYEKRKI